jgi:hypothetical protein
MPLAQRSNQRRELTGLVFGWKMDEQTPAGLNEYIRAHGLAAAQQTGLEIPRLAIERFELRPEHVNAIDQTMTMFAMERRLFGFAAYDDDAEMVVHSYADLLEMPLLELDASKVSVAEAAAQLAPLAKTDSIVHLKGLAGSPLEAALKLNESGVAQLEIDGHPPVALGELGSVLVSWAPESRPRPELYESLVSAQVSEIEEPPLQHDLSPTVGAVAQGVAKRLQAQASFPELHDLSDELKTSIALSASVFYDNLTNLPSQAGILSVPTPGQMADAWAYFLVRYANDLSSIADDNERFETAFHQAFMHGPLSTCLRSDFDGSHMLIESMAEGAKPVAEHVRDLIYG